VVMIVRGVHTQGRAVLVNTVCEALVLRRGGLRPVTLTLPVLSEQLHRVSAQQTLPLEHLYPVGEVGHVYQGGVAQAQAGGGTGSGPEIILHPLLSWVRPRGAGDAVSDVVGEVV